jgi:hypothetical protein
MQSTKFKSAIFDKVQIKKSFTSSLTELELYHH